MKADLAQCRKCGSFTLLGVDPVRVAVDVSPLDGAGYTSAIIGRIELYVAEKGQNGAWKLRTAPPGSFAASWGENGAQIGAQRLHRAHACSSEFSRAVKATPKAPAAPVTPGGVRDGHRQPAVPGAASSAPTRHCPVAPATRRPSEVGARCDICTKLIDQTTEQFTGIFHERWIWAVHEECA